MQAKHYGAFKNRVMKKFLSRLTLLILLLSGFMPQNTFSQKNFIFTIEFYPSFIQPCRLVMRKNGDSLILTIDNLFDKKNFKTTKGEDLIMESFDSLLIDKWFRSYYGDTMFIQQLEKAIVSANNYKIFLDSLSTVDLRKQTSLIKDNILDGITIYLRYQTDSIDNKFSLRCPDPSDKSEFKIIRALINLAESSFKTEVANNYLEHLKGYFDFGLLVKYISDNPLEYRFYCYLSSNEADEFYKLMDSLPKDKPIIIDLSNFQGMGTMFYDDFEELIQMNHYVYWLVNDYSIKQVKEIGVKSNRIFHDRQTLLKKSKTRHNMLATATKSALTVLSKASSLLRLQATRYRAF